MGQIKKTYAKSVPDTRRAMVPGDRTEAGPALRLVKNDEPQQEPLPVAA